jgi:hypothetical protein
MTPTRQQLERAYNDAVARAGRGAAVDAVLKASGQVFVSETPDDKIEATIAALASVPAKAAGKALQLARGPRLSVVDGLNAMARSIYPH